MSIRIVYDEFCDTCPSGLWCEIVATSYNDNPNRNMPKKSVTIRDLMLAGF